ncbi:MAG TPA: cobalt transporter CbiM [Desulfobacterales bacterium]|nr:cobalt transporter CbiM [Desulfobacterales bacterium]
MHISEGILSAPMLIMGGAITAAGTVIGLKHLDGERVMTTAMLTSAFFVASLIHVPIGPANIHLILTGLMGITLGWACFPAILVALFLQMLLFQFGGLTVLGVNTMNMAVPALLSGILFRPLLQKSAKHQKIGGFAAGFFAVFLGTILVSLAVLSTGEPFLATAKLVFLSHIPLMFIEGIITLFTVTFLIKVQPDFLGLNK